MSGSSNSGNGGNGGRGSEEEPNCAQLKIRTQLSTPDSEVIAILQVGDILSIMLGGPMGPIQVVTDNGQIAGAILSKEQAKLVKCISNGQDFQVEILGIDGGNCQILIFAK